MAKSNEPFWWALFGAGGMVAALLMPITIVCTSVLLMTGWVQPSQLWQLSVHPLARLYLFILIAFPLIHWAHRFRFTLVDLGLKAGRTVIAVICYGAAILGTVLAALMLLGVWPRVTIG
jgi:fumarate reductase subunit D